MLRSPLFATVFATAYLLAYCILLYTSGTDGLASLLFMLSPLLLAWLAYTILKYGRFEGRELGEEEEWGYGDRQ